MTSSTLFNPPRNHNHNHNHNRNTNSNPNFNTNPNLSLHLTDTSFTPLFSTSSRPSTSTSNQPPTAKALQTPSLTTLTTTALSAYNASLHLNLGPPQRIIIETKSSGPILLHSFVSPSSSPSASAQRSARHPRYSTHTPTSTQQQINGLENTNGASSIRGLEILSAAREELRPLSGTTEGSHSKLEHHDVRDEGAQVPLLVGTVVARSAEQIGEARRAAQRIEIAAHGFQRELIKNAEGKREGEDEGTVRDG